LVVISTSVSITKLCRTQAEVILYHANPNIHDIGDPYNGNTRG
jgi:hypothetical protein